MIVYKSQSGVTFSDDHIEPAFVTKLGFGLEKRKFIDKDALTIDSLYIHYKEQEFKITSRRKPHNREWINFYSYKYKKSIK